MAVLRSKEILPRWSVSCWISHRSSSAAQAEGGESGGAKLKQMFALLVRLLLALPPVLVGGRGSKQCGEAAMMQHK